MTEQTLTQEQAVINVQDALKRKLQIIKRTGNFETFAFEKAQSELAMLLLFKEMKESGEYKGIPYIDENGEEKFTNDIGEFCKFILGESKSSLYEKLQNLDAFGQDFFKKSARLGLGVKDLRLLRQSSTETQQLLLNNESVDLNNKESVEEFFEDLKFQNSTQLAEANKRGDDLKTNLDVAREMSAEKDQELNALKEQEAKRQMRQEPWQRDTLDAVNAMIEARAGITHSINQIGDVLSSLSENHALDDKAIDLIAQSLLTEVQHNVRVINGLSNDAFSILGSKYSPELPVDELYNQLHNEELQTLPVE